MDENILDTFRRIISERTGLLVRPHDSGSLVSAIHGRMDARRLKSASEYLALIEREGESSAEWEELRARLLIGESYFFRDRSQFELLRREILPELIRKKSKERSLRVLSAGCSSGEEPVSVAILLDELLPGEQWDISVIGTDVSDASLARAREGVYGPWSFRMVDPGVQARYFTGAGTRFKLSDRIRRTVAYKKCDLLKGPLPLCGLKGLDLILCRNVFIYYVRKAVEEMVAVFSSALSEGGYMVTGHGELYAIDLKGLKAVVYPESTVYRKPALDESPGVAEPEAAPLGHARVEAGAGEARVGARLSGSKKEGPPEASAEILFSKGLYREAIEALRGALQEARPNPRALYIAAASHANMGEYERATELLKRCVEADRDSAGPYYLLAHISEERGEAGKAKEYLRKIIYLRPGSAAAYVELSALYDGEGDVERAAKMRAAALGILKSLPQETLLEPYENITASELIDYIKRL